METIIDTSLAIANPHGTVGRVADPKLAAAREAWAALAPGLAGCARVRVGRWSVKSARPKLDYRDRDERRLTTTLPEAPAAVRVYGPDGCCAALIFDLDTGRGSAADVERDQATLVRVLESAGARVITDVSPSLGRHVYVPLAQRLDQVSALEILDALTVRLPTLDTGPHTNVRSGCIRTPGSRHKGVPGDFGGYQELTMPLARAVDVLRRPNGPHVIDALRLILADDIANRAALHAGTRTAARAVATSTPIDVDDAIETGGRVWNLSPTLVAIARQGYDPTTGPYRSASEARMAVIAGAARAGWHLADVQARFEDGRWAGLRALYASVGRGRERTLLAREWVKAVAFVRDNTTTSKNNPVHRYDTSARGSRGGGGTRGVGLNDPGDVHGFLRTWRRLILLREHSLRGPGSTIKRFLLRTLAAFAHSSSTADLEIGVRGLAIGCGCDKATVAILLQELTNEGWLDLLERGRGTRADHYLLTLPPGIDPATERLTWEKGKIHGLRPAFRVLGHTNALIFEAVENGRAHTITELVATTRLSRSTVYASVDELRAWDLLHDTPTGLAARPHNLNRVAEDLGALEAVAHQLTTYAQQRTQWHTYLQRHHTQPPDTNDEPDTDWWWPPDDATHPAWIQIPPHNPPIKPHWNNA